MYSQDLTKRLSSELSHNVKVCERFFVVSFPPLVKSRNPYLFLLLSIILLCSSNRWISLSLVNCASCIPLTNSYSCFGCSFRYFCFIGLCQKAVSLWVHDPATRDATIVRQALSGDIVDLKAATEVICSRTPTQIQQFKQIYFSIFGTYLEHDIEYQASGDHKKVIHSLSLSLCMCVLQCLCCC